ncbi:MAG: hypothetical protein R2827_08615 [Bdellovibrionales bacterium]
MVREFVFDQSYTQQPEGRFNISSPQPIKFDSLSIPQASLVFSDIEFSTLVLKGQMKDGDIAISELTLGSAKNDLFIQARGGVTVSFTKTGTRLSRYDLQMRLIRSSNLVKKDQFIANSLDFLFDDSKAKITENAQGKTYQFRMRGLSRGMPQLTPLAQF